MSVWALAPLAHGAQCPAPTILAPSVTHPDGLLCLQVVSRCLELGAASAHYVPGSMEDTNFVDSFVDNATRLLGEALALSGALPGTPGRGRPKVPPESLKAPSSVTGGLDMLILNHLMNSPMRLFPVDMATVRRNQQVNFLSYVALSTAAQPLLWASNGSLVVVSSLAGECHLEPGQTKLWKPRLLCQSVYLFPSPYICLSICRSICLFCVFAAWGW